MSSSMKKFLVIVAVLAILQNWEEIKATFVPAPDYGAMYDAEVILYSTEWCGYCDKARNLMARYNIPYSERDIEKSEEARLEHKKIGGRGVPVLLINGQMVNGYNRSRILELVEKSQFYKILVSLNISSIKSY